MNTANDGPAYVDATADHRVLGGKCESAQPRLLRVDIGGIPEYGLRGTAQEIGNGAELLSPVIDPSTKCIGCDRRPDCLSSRPHQLRASHLDLHRALVEF